MPYRNSQYSQMTAGDKLFGTIELAPARLAMIKQTYLLLGVSVFAAVAGGYIGAQSGVMVSLFSSWLGWILALVLLNVIPFIAMAARHNPVLGVSALVFDGFLSGLVLSPILYIASRVAPGITPMALGITALIFLAISGYVFLAKRTFSAPRGLMLGMFVAIIGATVLNGFLHIGALGMLISVGVGIFGMAALVYSTSDVLNNPEADSPIPGALMLFAGLFNVFVAVLNILLRFNSSNRD